jgi:hypothetical protein
MITAIGGLVVSAGLLLQPIPVTTSYSYPYSHVSVQAASAPGVNAPTGGLWVSVDDGSATPRSAVARAVPADGRKSLDAAYTDPAACEQVGSQQGVCWRYWQRVGDEVRIWTTYQRHSCVLIASLGGEPTRINCDGHAITGIPEHRNAGLSGDTQDAGTVR